MVPSPNWGGVGRGESLCRLLAVENELTNNCERSDQSTKKLCRLDFTGGEAYLQNPIVKDGVAGVTLG